MTIRHGMRVGAAAFALGVALAGPAGLATADGGDADAAVSAGSGDVRAGAQRAARTPSDSQPAQVASRADSTAGAPVAARRAGGSPQRAATDRGGAGARDLAGPAAVRDRSRGSVALRGTPVDRVDRTVAVASGAGAVAPAAAQVPSINNHLPNGTEVEGATDSGESLGTTGPADVQESLTRLNIAVAGFFDSVTRLLSTLPANPFSDLLSGALLLVRRTLFNQLPTASPAQLFPNAAGQISGSIGASDPEGDILTYRLIETPRFGIVQIGPDGTYDYFPGADYAGSDSFVVAVSDGGFNVLNPFGSRSTAVAVQVPDESLLGPPVGVSRGFNVTNLTGQAIYLADIQKEAGYETRVESAPNIGSVLKPGETAHFETTYLYFYSYDTRAIWKSCADVSCTAPTPGDKQWTVRLHTWSGQFWDSDGPTTLNCEVGSCNYRVDGQPQDNWADGANQALLLDPPGTQIRLSAGVDSDKVAKVLDNLCQNQYGASCSFSPKRFEQTQSAWILAQSLKNSTGTTVTQALTRNNTTSTQTSLKIGESAKLNLFKVVEAGVSRETTETWTSQVSWQETYTVPIPSGETGYLYYRDPIKRVTGDFTATIGNTTWNLTDVNFDTPDPDTSRPDGGRPQYEARNSPKAGAV